MQLQSGGQWSASSPWDDDPAYPVRKGSVIARETLVDPSCSQNPQGSSSHVHMLVDERLTCNVLDSRAGRSMSFVPETYSGLAGRTSGTSTRIDLVEVSLSARCPQQRSETTKRSNHGLGCSSSWPRALPPRRTKRRELDGPLWTSDH